MNDRIEYVYTLITHSEEGNPTKEEVVVTGEIESDPTGKHYIKRDDLLEPFLRMLEGAGYIVDDVRAATGL